MEKKVLTLNYQLVVEVDERIQTCDTLGESIGKGFAKVISSDIQTACDDGTVCEDKGILENTKKAITNSLMSI